VVGFLKTPIAVYLRGSQMLLSIPEVLTRTGLPERTFYWLRKHDRFPQPMRIGPRDRAYPAAVIDEWIAAHRGERQTTE
jgi:predicted DNA-binding transcriptional regulator AlpA